MPLLTSKGRYGLAAICEIAKHSKTTPISKKDIAGRANIPVNYLDQLLMKLREAGFVESIRGVHGGYVLSKRADEIILLDVLRALEGELNVINDVDKDTVLGLFFEDIQEKIEKLFTIKLSEIAKYNTKFLHYQI